ncbi:uncharacterized protein LOC119160919 isoform X5 [Rhipicephalus microplus]|uniref:uncharacterized protein LOC119160919 isoform X5 n=1 Tax=Rhipicephalus microplus TaxID=6941 RepID=UPI003F6D42D7
MRMRNVNAAPAQLCLERGFTFLDSLVDSWPGFLSRDGVHPSRLGNKVLADFLYREACVLSTHLERRRIQQSYKESKASAWSGWARQEHFAINLEADFPALAVRDFTKQDLFDKACIPDRWCKDHFLSDSCTTTTATPVVTSSIQSPPCVKLDIAQEKYTYAYRSLCKISKTMANVLSNCGEKELIEKLSSCEAFFRN